MEVLGGIIRRLEEAYSQVRRRGYETCARAVAACAIAAGASLDNSGRQFLTRRAYFVDESGDGVLFDRRGRELIGSEGISRFFILGMLDVAEPEKLDQSLNELRGILLKDSYFKNVPSMQERARKTALGFHAKNDLPEVRREVFRVIVGHDVRFIAVVKDMAAVLQYVRDRNKAEPTYRYHPDELYDYAARRLFRPKLHKEDEYNVVFSRRGSSDRTRVLAEALETARADFCTRKIVNKAGVIRVRCAFPHEYGGLQAADYFLWALRRVYERHEERFVHFVWPKVSLVHDVDDCRESAYGVYYTSKKLITAASIERGSRI